MRAKSTKATGGKRQPRSRVAAHRKAGITAVVYADLRSGARQRQLEPSTNDARLTENLWLVLEAALDDARLKPETLRRLGDRYTLWEVKFSVTGELAPLDDDLRRALRTALSGAIQDHPRPSAVLDSPHFKLQISLTTAAVALKLGATLEKIESSSAPITLLELREFKKQVLDRIEDLRGRFREDVILRLADQGFGENNGAIAAEVNALLELLGLQLVDPRHPKQRAYLRCKSVPGTVGGALEIRTQRNGNRQVLSSKTRFPERLVIRDRPTSGDSDV